MEDPFAVSENPVVPERLSEIAAPPANRRGAGRIFDRVIAVAIAAGLLPCTTLLLSMDYDFGREYSVLCILPTLFFACVIWLIAWNVLFAFRGRLPQSPLSRWRRLLLASAIPAGLFASALGCMGLSLTGCSRTCGMLSLFGIPAGAIVSLAYIFWPRPGILLAMLCSLQAFWSRTAPAITW